MSNLNKGLAAFAGVACAVWLGVFAWARLPGYKPLADGDRAEVMRRLRAALDGQPVTANTSRSST